MASSDTDSRPLVVMTGANGLIGQRIIRKLQNSYRLVGLDIDIPDFERQDVVWIETDLTDDGSTRHALQRVADQLGTHLASVIHLAAYYDFSGEDSPLYDKLTVQGTHRLLESLQSFDVEQFIFSSSLLVMEPTKKGKHLSETSPVRPTWAYPRSKVEAEKIIQAHHGTIPYVILRIAGVYDEMCHSLPLSQQISRIYEKQLESYMFPGDIDAGQALVHLEDLAECFLRTVEARHSLDSEELFLIAEPDVMSYAELQETIGGLIHGTQWPTIRIPKIVAKSGAWVKEQLATSDEEKPFIKPWMISHADDHYAVNISHAQVKVGWDPAHRLRKTIPEIIANLHANPRGWYEENNLPWPEDRDDLPVSPPFSMRRAEEHQSAEESRPAG